MTAAAIFTAVAQVGIALTVVGKVTKSKELTKIGGVMSLVGGIGSLATAAYNAVGAAAAGGEVGVSAAAEGAATAAGEEALTGAAMDAGMEAAGAAATDAAVTTFPVDVPTLDGMSGAGMLQSAAPAAAAAPAANVAPAAMQPQSATEMFNSNMAAATPAPVGAAFDVGTTGAVAAPTDSSAFGIKKWFDGLDKATQGKVLNGAMQIGGQAVGGLFNGWSEEQKLALEQQRQSLLQREADTRTANANAQPSVAAYVKPTGMMGS